MCVCVCVYICVYIYVYIYIYVHIQFPYRQCIDICIFYQTLPHVSPIEIYVFLRAVIPRNTRWVISVVLWQIGLAADVMYR